MATTSRKQTIGHAQVRTSVDAPGLVASARPSALNTPAIQPDLSAAKSMLRISQATRGIGAELGRIAAKRQEKESIEQDMLGRAARIKAGNSDIEKYQSENGVKFSINAAKGFNIASAKADAARDAMVLGRMVDDQGDSFATDEQLTSAFGKVFEKTAKGNPSADYTAAYFEAIQPHEVKAREAWRANKYLANQAGARSDLHVAIRGDMEALAASGADGQSMATQRRTWYELADMMGIPKSEVAEWEHELGLEVSLAHDTDAFFADDGMFSFESSSVSEPGQRIPAKLDSDKWRSRVLDARNDILKARAAKEETISKANTFQLGMEIENALRNGQPSKAYELAVQGGLDETLAPGTALDYVQDSLDAIEFNTNVSTAMTVRDHPLMFNQFSKAVQDEVHKQTGDEILKGMGPEGELDGRQGIQMLADQTTEDYVHPGLSSMLNGGNLGTAFDTYSIVRKRTGHALTRLIPNEDRRAMLSTIDNLVASGRSKEEAIALVEARMQPEALERSRQRMQTKKTVRADLVESLSDIKHERDWAWDNTAEIEGGGFLHDKAYELYEIGITVYGKDHEQAVEWADEEIRRQYMFVSEDGESDRGRMVYHGGSLLEPKILKGAQRGISDAVRAEMVKTGQEPSPFYSFGNNPMDPQSDDKIVYDADGRIVLDGTGNPKVISQRAAVAAAKKIEMDTGMAAAKDAAAKAKEQRDTMGAIPKSRRARRAAQTPGLMVDVTPKEAHERAAAQRKAAEEARITEIPWERTRTKRKR